MGILYTDTRLSVLLQSVVIPQECPFRNVLAGQGGEIWHHSCMVGKTHQGKFSFSVQESQCVYLLYSTRRKSIAEGFLLRDLCFMKFLPGAEKDWGAGNDSAVFLPSAALIVCNDLISSTILPCSKHRHVAVYYLYYDLCLEFLCCISFFADLVQSLEKSLWKLNFVLSNFWVLSQHQIHATIWEGNNMDKWHNLNKEMLLALYVHKCTPGEEEQTRYKLPVLAENEWK